jgi:hypothetical protein
MEDRTNGQPESGGRTTTGVPQIDSTILHWLAEEAHGRQGSRNLILVKDAKGQPALRNSEGEGGVQATDEVLFEVTTPPSAPQLKPPQKIILQVPGGKEERLDKLEGCDSLFWSRSAIEKFLFPYYAAHRLLTEKEMADLRSKCQAEDVVAILHIAPSKSLTRTGKDRFLIVRQGEEMIGLKEFLAP